MTTETTTTAADKSNREVFLATSKTIIGGAVRNGSNMARIRALREYMREVLDGSTKDNCDELKAKIVGEMFSTHEDAAKAIIAFAKAKAKYDGSDCGLAMAAISEEHGIYSPTAEIWAHVAKALTESKKSSKDYGDLWRSLRAELRSVAVKANGQMNEILKQNGVKEKKKGGFGKKKEEEAVSVEMEAITPDKMVTEVCKLDSEQQLEALKLLVEAMLINGVEAGQIADTVEGILVQLPAVANAA